MFVFVNDIFPTVAIHIFKLHFLIYPGILLHILLKIKATVPVTIIPTIPKGEPHIIPINCLSLFVIGIYS